MSEFLTVAQAVGLTCCRICRGPARPNDTGPFVLDYGHEFAHRSCLEREELTSRLAFIESSLETMKTWHNSDYREFYKRDIDILLPLAKAYLQQNPVSSVKPVAQTSIPS